MRFTPFTEILYWTLRLTHRFDRRTRDQKDFNPSRVKRILAVSTTALGDTIMSTAGICALRERYPEAHLTALLNPLNGQILNHDRSINERIFYSGRYKNFWHTLLVLRRKKFDVAAILHGNEPQITPLLYMAGIPFIFKLPNTSRYRFLLSNKGSVMTWSNLGHGLDQRCEVATLAGCQDPSRRIQLTIDPKARGAAHSILQKFGVRQPSIIIGFQIGASKAIRQWPASSFIELGQRLRAIDRSLYILVMGSPNEQSLADHISVKIGVNCISVAGKVPLDALPTLVTLMDLLVTGDTGPMHIAFAVDTPTVCLFAATNPAGSGPYEQTQRHTVIAKPWNLSDQNLPQPMARITVEEVESAVKRLLTRSERQKKCASY